MSSEWDFYKEKLDKEFLKIKDKFNEKIKKIHTTRLHPDLISDVLVSYCGDDVPLKTIANIQLTSARSFTIKPYDSSSCNEIEKAIRKSKSDFNPIISSGTVILSFPSPTEESRKKSVKELKVLSEESKISLRILRQNIQQEIKKNELPKDLEKKFLDNLSQFCKQSTDAIDIICNDKEKELMTV